MSSNNTLLQNIVNGLGYGIIILLTIFIVWLIYKTFIKNNILIREPYEDIKIVVESQCPEGHYFNSQTVGDQVLDECTACLASNGTAVTDDGAGCLPCDQWEGKGTETKVVNGQELGIRCIECSEGIPDPNTIGARKCQTVLSFIDTTSRTANQFSYGVFATGINNTNVGNLIISVNVSRDEFKDDGSFNGSTGRFVKKGVRETDLNINTLNLTYTGSTPPLDIRTPFNTNYVNNVSSDNKRNYAKFLRFLFTSVRNRLNLLFSVVAFGGNANTITSPNPSLVDPATVITLLDSTGAEITLSSLDNIINAANITTTITGIRIKSPYTCGTPIQYVDPNNAGCTTTTPSTMTKTISYDEMVATNISGTNFANRCKTELVTNAPCDIGSVNCELSTSAFGNKPSSFQKLAPVYNDGNQTYTFTDVYIYNIAKLPQGNGTKCQDLSYFSETGVNLNPTKTGSPPELIINNGVATITRTSSVRWVSNVLNLATPGSYTTNNNYQTDPALFGKYVIFKSGGTTVSSSNNAPSPYVNNILPVIIIDKQRNINSSATDFYNTSNKTRTTILTATRTVSEPVKIDVNSNSSDNNNAYPLLKQLLTNMGVVASDNLIRSIRFAPSTFGVANQVGAVSTINANEYLSPPPTVTAATQPALTTSIFNSVTPIVASMSYIATNNSNLNFTVVQQNSGTNNGKIYRMNYTNTPVTSTEVTSTLFTQPLAWTSVVSSNDGAYQTALAFGNGIYTSYSSGTANSWLKATVNVDNFIQGAMIRDGSVQFAVAGPLGFLYYSINSGLTWTQYSVANAAAGSVESILSSRQNWSAIAVGEIQANNTFRLVATIDGGNLYTANVNVGALGTNVPVAGTSVTVRQRASISFAWARPQGSNTTGCDGIRDPNIITSGQCDTYDMNFSAKSWRQVTLSADGATQIAIVGNGGYIYRSTDSGVNWRYGNIVIDGQLQIASGIGRKWMDIKVSRDNPLLAVAIENTYNFTTPASVDFSNAVYFTRDGGLNWTSITATKNAAQNWSSLSLATSGTQTIAYVSSMQGRIISFAIPA